MKLDLLPFPMVQLLLDQHDVYMCQAFADYPGDLPPLPQKSLGGYVTPSNSIHDDAASVEVSRRCVCAQQHTDLLAHLCAIRQQSAPISVNALLATGQHTLATWSTEGILDALVNGDEGLIEQSVGTELIVLLTDCMTFSVVAGRGSYKEV